jgi:hypothetical protein
MVALEKSDERKTREDPTLNRSGYCSPEVIWLTASGAQQRIGSPAPHHFGVSRSSENMIAGAAKIVGRGLGKDDVVRAAAVHKCGYNFRSFPRERVWFCQSSNLIKRQFCEAKRLTDLAPLAPSSTARRRRRQRVQRNFH